MTAQNFNFEPKFPQSKEFPATNFVSHWGKIKSSSCVLSCTRIYPSPTKKMVSACFATLHPGWFASCLVQLRIAQAERANQRERVKWQTGRKNHNSKRCNSTTSVQQKSQTPPNTHEWSSLELLSTLLTSQVRKGFGAANIWWVPTISIWPKFTQNVRLSDQKFVLLGKNCVKSQKTLDDLKSPLPQHHCFSVTEYDMKCQTNNE